MCNHFWWSILTCKTRQDFVERLQSIRFHVKNKHEWIDCTYYKQCIHELLLSAEERKIKWLKLSSPAYVELRKIYMRVRVKKDLLQVRDATNTTRLEVSKCLCCYERVA